MSAGETRVMPGAAARTVPTVHRARSRRSLGTDALAVLLVCAVAACGDSRAAGDREAVDGDGITVTGGQTFDEVFVVVDTISLEESPTVVNVSPRVVADWRGGFIVADPSEHQVRFYSNNGSLKRVIDGKDGPPGSINRPQRAKRLPSGEVLVANLQGPLTVVGDQPDRAFRVLPISLHTIKGFEILNSARVLLTGNDSAPPTTTLFPVDLREERIVDRVLPPPAHLDKWVTTYFSTVQTAGRGARVAAVHMLSDTLLFLDYDGVELSRTPIPIDPFVVPMGPLPDLPSERQRQEWMSQFTIMSSVWWVADNLIVIQWHKPRPDGGMDWGILRMDTSGVRTWAVAPVPYLYTVVGDRFFFRDPSSGAPNRWLVAEERR